MNVSLIGTSLEKKGVLNQPREGKGEVKITMMSFPWHLNLREII